MKPLLLVDAGNSLIKWAVVASLGGKIEVKGEIPTRETTAATIKRLAGDFGGHRAVLASVVPQVTSWFEEGFGKSLSVLTAETSGLFFTYPNPAQLGADRLAAALAAFHGKLYPCIIVSCGTATAFTALDERGAFCGGAIAPGPQTQIDSLAGAAAQLPAISLAGSHDLPAKSTEEAIRAGVILGFRGGVKEIVAELREKMGGNPRVILTGGHAEMVRSVIRDAELRPLLVFEGLRIMGERSSAARFS